MTSCLDSLFDLTRRAVSRAFDSAPDTPRYAVDATAGNGHDTLFLADLVGESGRVWAFDVQEAALASTRRLLEDHGLSHRAVLMLQGHETAGTTLPREARGALRAATFNLGYLPGSGKSIVTRPKSTITALASFQSMMAVNGVISVHVYRGHPGGEEEFRAVQAWFADLPWETWRVASCGFANKARNREHLFLANRIG